MIDLSVCWFLCLLFVGKCWKKWGFAHVNISKYIHICAPLLPEGRGAPQSVMGRCSPSSSTSSPHELAGAGAVGRSREMRRERNEIPCEAHAAFISHSAIKMTLLA